MRPSPLHRARVRRAGPCGARPQIMHARIFGTPRVTIKQCRLPRRGTRNQLQKWAGCFRRPRQRLISSRPHFRGDFSMCATTASRQHKWRILLALFFSATIALAPAIADARGGSSYGGRSSSMGSRGSRTYEPNGAQPLSRSVTPAPDAPRQPGVTPTMPSPAYGGGYGGGSFFQRHPFLTGLAGGLFGSWLFGHSGWATDGVGSGGSMLGGLLQLLIIGLIIYFVVRLVRGWAFANGARGGGTNWPPRSAGAAAAAARG